MGYEVYLDELEDALKKKGVDIQDLNIVDVTDEYEEREEETEQKGKLQGK